MFDIGFWELLVIAVVLLLVMGPERLPEVARQLAFLVRKIRQGMFRLRSEMQGELDSTPFSELQKARQEMSDFKNDIRQFGKDLVNTAEQIEATTTPPGEAAADVEKVAEMKPAASKTSAKGHGTAAQKTVKKQTKDSA